MARDVTGREKVLVHAREKKVIRHAKSKRKEHPANTFSKEDIDAILQALKSYDGYPKLRELAGIVPALTPVQLNFAVRYMERTGAIVIDDDGYIIWRRDVSRESLTLGEAGVLSDDVRRFVRDL